MVIENRMENTGSVLPCCNIMSTTKSLPPGSMASKTAFNKEAANPGSSWCSAPE
jgi:hypothetical protein